MAIFVIGDWFLAKNSLANSDKGIINAIDNNVGGKYPNPVKVIRR